jgi:molybdenum cofactor cytidylyltransferase
VSDVAGIVLAAGQSRRMGRPKALLPFRGATFLDLAIALLKDAGADPVIVVVGHEPDAIRPSSPERVFIVHNPYHLDGQFSSLQRGIEFVVSEQFRESFGEPRAVLVALVDQPHVPARTGRALVQEFQATGAPIVRPVWQGRGGHPLLLSAETFPALLELPRTGTTYDLVKLFFPRRRDVASPDDSIVTDVDTPEDYSRLTENG